MLAEKVSLLISGRKLQGVAVKNNTSNEPTEIFLNKESMDCNREKIKILLLFFCKSNFDIYV